MKSQSVYKFHYSRHLKWYFVNNEVIPEHHERAFKLSRPFKMIEFVHSLAICTGSNDRFAFLQAEVNPSQSTNRDDVKPCLAIIDKHPGMPFDGHCVCTAGYVYGYDQFHSWRPDDTCQNWTSIGQVPANARLILVPFQHVQRDFCCYLFMIMMSPIHWKHISINLYKAMGKVAPFDVSVYVKTSVSLKNQYYDSCRHQGIRRYIFTSDIGFIPKHLTLSLLFKVLFLCFQINTFVFTNEQNLQLWFIITVKSLI